MALDRFGGGCSRRSFIRGGVAAAGATALAACTNKNSPRAKGHVGSDGIVGFFIGDPVSIDPYNVQETSGSQVERCLFDPLTQYDWATGELVPCAAESWEVSEDATEYTFHLVKGAKFHNGDPVVAADFKRGMERMCDTGMVTPSQISYHLAPVVGVAEMLAGEATSISGITCPDDHTLVFKLTAPMSDWPIVCSHAAMVPVPQAALDDPSDFLMAPIGNGPFEMDGQWMAGQYISVKRFDDYYGERAGIAAVNFSIQRDPETAFREFEAGNIDFTNIPSGRLKDIEATYGTSEDGYTVTPGKQVLTGVLAGCYYLACDCEDEVMSRLEVRKAISLAINRQNICDTVYQGSRKPATNIFPPIIDDDPSDEWEFCHYDRDAAQAIVDEYGLAGTKLTLSYNSGGGHEDIMSIIQGDLEAVGFEVTQSSQEWASYLQAMNDGNFQLGRFAWTADYPTMDNFLYPNFYSTADNNYSKWGSAEFDAAIDAARQISNPDARRLAYRAANKIVGDALPAIPIMWYAHNHVGSDKFKSLYYDAMGTAHLASCTLEG